MSGAVGQVSYTLYDLKNINTALVIDS